MRSRRLSFAALAAIAVLAAWAAIALGATGDIRTVAGKGTPGFSGDGGPATQAELKGARGLAALPGGGYLIADSDNNRIRKVDAAGVISTVAGNGTAGATGDEGPAVDAELVGPRGVAVTPNGGFLIADTGNDKVRYVSPDGKIHTVAGTGTEGFSGDGGPATAAKLGFARSVASLPGGGFLIADHSECVIREVDAAGIISTVAGTAPDPSTHCGSTGNEGAATSAQLSVVTNVASVPGGGFLIADGSVDVVRYVDSGGTIHASAGTGTGGYEGDGGAATAAKIDGPRGLAPLPGGGYLFADSNNDVIRKVDAAGKITTVAGKQAAGPGFSGDNGPATAAQLKGPEDVALQPHGGFLIMDTGNQRVRRVLGAVPVKLAAPAISGTPFPGALLSCSKGMWLNDPTSFAFAWFRDGVKLGETSATYKVAGADAGHQIACSVTAANESGAGAPASSTAAGVPLLTLAGKPKVKGRKIVFKVRCAAAACSGQAVETFKKGKKRVTAGKRSFDLAPGATKKVKVKLNKKGRKRLKRAGKLKVRLRVAELGPSGLRVRVASVKRTIKHG